MRSAAVVWPRYVKENALFSLGTRLSSSFDHHLFAGGLLEEFSISPHPRLRLSVNIKVPSCLSENVYLTCDYTLRQVRAFENSNLMNA